MKRRIEKKLHHFATGLALGLATSYPAIADDTEILIGNQLDPGSPNIAFIIDTSGSMESDVVVGLDYDPLRTYAGTCTTDRLYWTREDAGTVTLPDCTLDTYVINKAFQCHSAGEALAQVGQFRDRYAQLDTTREPDTWVLLARASENSDIDGSVRLTECASDAGVHGDTLGDFYPADGTAGPWTTDVNLGIDWPSSGALYTVFHGNYLNWIQETGQETTVSSRLEVVQRVARDVLTPLNGVNVALMRFSTNAEGGMLLQEMVPVEQGRSDIIDAVNSMTPEGATPLTETLYEAAQYYAGRLVDFGVNSTGTAGAPLPSVPESQDAAGNYISPITRQCQRNYVVMLTDGLPTRDTDANPRIQDLPGFGDTCSGSCLNELADYLSAKDQIADGTFDDDQTVQTFTIGFHTDQDLLKQAATGRIPVLDANGDPVLDANGEPETEAGYFIANDQAQLAKAFDSIISAIQSDGEIFNSPSLSVDVQNRLTNRDDLYFAMFQPPTRGEPHWDGNLKKYRIGRAADASADSVPRVLDVNGAPAVDDDGLFVDGAQSFWSLNPDEGFVTEGGFAGTLTANRNVYSNVTSGQLSAGSNAVHESNGALTAALLGVDPADREALLQFARGVDADGNARAVIGDPLHSAPVLVPYANDNFALFFGTNDGMLHAIDPEPVGRGVQNIEHFAFIPRELLPQLATIKANTAQPQFNAAKAYGLDGPITAWIDEDNNNNVVESGETAYLFVSMRRGGRNYYALDVTDVANPTLVWSIIGGSGDFTELGQTWSAPIPSRIRWNGSERQVLFFAGGNDTNQDQRNRPTIADDMGRAIYMVDALTGDRLWWASIADAADLTLPDMTHSIPSNLQLIDTDQDGLDDRIYVGDTTAQVWRFDIDNINSTITGDVFAKLGAIGESGNRRIYGAPSVTRIIDEHTGQTFLTVSVGTGHRAHPLEADVDDAFFMMRDLNAFAAPVDENQIVTYPDPIEPIDLRDVTNNIAPSTDDLAGRQGWFIDFAAVGEKSLSAPLTVLDRIFFTTYQPTLRSLGCQPEPVLGTGRLYTVDILTGAPLVADATVPSDRYQELDSMGIPPSPTLVFTEPPCIDCEAGDPVSEITMLVGTEAIAPGVINVPRKTYWVQEDIDR